MDSILRLRWITLLLLAWGYPVAAAPISTADIVTVGNTRWAQPDLFLGISWDDVNAVCPGGVCGTGTLNGHEVAGWSWATLEAMNQLFNSYIGTPVMGPGPDNYFTDNFTVSTAFYADGWRITGTFADWAAATRGLVSDTDAFAAEMGALYANPVVPWATGDRLWTEVEAQYAIYGPESTGLWLYQENLEVPLPPALGLMLLQLAGLGLLKLRKK